MFSTGAFNTRPATGSFSRKILTVLSVVLAVALLGSGIGYLSLFNVSTETTAMVDDVMTTERLASDLHHQIAVNIARSKALAMSAEPQVGDALTPEITQTTAHIDSLIKQLDGRLMLAEDRAILARMQTDNAHFSKAYQALTLARDSGLTSRIEEVVTTSFLPAANALQASVVALGTAQRTKITEAAARISDLSRHARWGLVVFGVCAMVLGAWLSVWLVRGISRPITQAVHAANRIASLDLSAPIEGHQRDEAGRLLIALGRMQAALQSLVCEVQGTSHHVAEGATQIATGNRNFSSHTETAASFLKQTAASLDELASSMHESLVAARLGETMAQSAALNAATGSTVMSEVMQTMADINDSSRQIMDITSVIDSIAFQTNILALNAAVEAARAGEQGRGFAVVASEVRTLSNRSAAAARQIKALIDASAAQVRLGTEKATRAQGSMSDIVNAVARVTQAIGQITAGHHIQSNRMVSISTAVNQLDQMTQQNAAVVEELTASAHHLQNQASDLRDVSGRFQLGGSALALV